MISKVFDRQKITAMTYQGTKRRMSNSVSVVNTKGLPISSKKFSWRIFKNEERKLKIRVAESAYERCSSVKKNEGTLGESYSMKLFFIITPIISVIHTK